MLQKVINRLARLFGDLELDGSARQVVNLQVRRAAEAGPVAIAVPVKRLQPRDAFLDAIRSSARIIAKDGRRIGYLRLWAFAFSGVEDLFRR